jgi:hypothetical protein
MKLSKLISVCHSFSFMQEFIDTGEGERGRERTKLVTRRMSLTEHGIRQIDYVTSIREQFLYLQMIQFII